jgi:hypothetical protein
MGFCDLPMMSTVCSAVSGAGDTLVMGIGAWIAKSCGELAQSAANLAASAVNATTAIDLNAGWFRHNYELLLPIGLVLIVGTMSLQLIRAAWTRDPGALWRALSGTMSGVFFAFSAIAGTTVAITVTDALSNGLFSLAGTSISAAVRRVTEVAELGMLNGLGWLLMAVVALGAAIGAFLFWGVMVFRKVGVLILVALASFAAAGGGWDAARRWRRGWIEATAALVFSKLLMTVVFLIGISALGQANAKTPMAALSDILAGTVVLVLVLLCPMITYRFVHWASDGSDMEGLHRGTGAGLTVAAGAAKSAGTWAMRAGGAGTGGSPQGPATIAGQDSGIASGGPDSGGDGINALSPVKTRFRFGENQNAVGDGGTPLIQRPPSTGDRGRPLVRRAGTDAEQPQYGMPSQAELRTPADQSAPGAEVRSAPAPSAPLSAYSPEPAAGDPPPQGGASQQRWVYPSVPPEGGSGPDSRGTT